MMAGNYKFISISVKLEKDIEPNSQLPTPQRDQGTETVKMAFRRTSPIISVVLGGGEAWQAVENKYIYN